MKSGKQSAYQLNPSDVIRLNVGGTYFETTPSTLSKASSPLLDEILSVMTEKKVTEAFIDRDPYTFSTVLSWLRHDKKLFFTTHEVYLYDILIEEADFFGIEELKQQATIKRNLILSTVVQ